MEQHEHKTSVEIDNDKVWAILAYIFFPIPLFVKNRSAFLNYHINQGIIFLIVGIIGSILIGWIPVLGWLFNLAMIVLFIIGIMNVSKKKKTPLPIIGGMFNFIKKS
jgi:uncharacterized membrane protein